MPGLNVGEYLGVRPRYSDSTNLGGASFVSHLQHAATAIDAGLCEVALIAYGSTQRADGGRLKSVAESFPVEAPYAPRYPISQFALAAARHMHEFGTTREQLSAVAVAAREWAARNERAFARDPLTLDDVAGARMISTPLTSRDACLVTDGGGRAARHERRARGVAAPAARAAARRRRGALAPQHLADAGPGPHGGDRVLRARVRDGRASRRATSTPSRSTTPSRSARSSSSRTSGCAPRARAARSSPTAGSRPAARCR